MAESEKTRKSILNLKVLIIFIIVVLVSALGFLGIWHSRHRQKNIPKFPAYITQQLVFPLFTADLGQYIIDSSSIKYDPTSKVVSFSASAYGTVFSFSEQPVPDAFTDIPQQYDKLLESMNEYKSFDTISGRVTLTKPTELKDDQTAVFKEKGTLLFVRPNKQISDDDWRKLFNTLTIQK